MQALKTNNSRSDSEVSGSVKWFCDTRGYGFLKGDNIKGDIFAHYSDIVSMDGYRNLRKGQEVTFSLCSEESKKIAKNISILS